MQVLSGMVRIHAGLNDNDNGIAFMILPWDIEFDGVPYDESIVCTGLRMIRDRPVILLAFLNQFGKRRAGSMEM